MEFLKNIKMVDPRSLSFEQQARRSFDPEHVEDLARKIAIEGFNPKKFVEARRKKDGTLVVFQGEHRTRGSVDAGVKEIPVLIIEEDHELSPLEIAQIHLEQCADNMGRPMEILEVVDAAEAALAEGIDIEEVAASLGKTVATIQKNRILAKAPGPVKEEMERGTISKQCAVHLTELSEMRISQKKSFKVGKILGKVKAVKGTKSMIIAADLYMAEVIKSEASRSQSMFDEDKAETEKTKKRDDKGFITMHNEKPFTVHHAESVFKQLMNVATKYVESPLGNGSADAIMRVDGKTTFEIKNLVEKLTKIAKKLEDVAISYDTKSKVANA